MGGSPSSGAQERVHPRARLGVALEQHLDFVLLATPPNGLETAVRGTAHLLAPDGGCPP